MWLLPFGSGKGPQFPIHADRSHGKPEAKQAVAPAIRGLQLRSAGLVFGARLIGREGSGRHPREARNETKLISCAAIGQEISAVQ